MYQVIIKQTVGRKNQTSKNKVNKLHYMIADTGETSIKG